MSLEAARFHDAVPQGNAVIIFNREAGTASYRKKRLIVSRAASRMIDHGWKVRVEETDSAGEVTKYAEKAVKDKADAVWAAGGDGTSQLTLPALLDSQNANTALGIIRLGTEDLWGRDVGISRIPEQAVDDQLAGGIRQMDVGLLNNRHPFRDVTGLHFDGKVISLIERSRTASGRRLLRGTPAYVAVAGLVYPFLSPTEAMIQFDGKPEKVSLLQAWIGNTRLLAHMELREGFIDDGQLEATVFPKMDPVTLVRNALPALYRHAMNRPIERAPAAKYYQGATGRIETSRPVYALVDGEIVSPTDTFVFSTLPGALRVFVSNNAKAQRLFST